MPSGSISCWRWTGCRAPTSTPHHRQRGAAVAVQPAQLWRRYLHIEPLVVGEDVRPRHRGPLLDRPEEAGADRLVNAVGRAWPTTAPLVIVDFGTATTFDVVAATALRGRRDRARHQPLACRRCTTRPPSCRASPSAAPRPGDRQRHRRLRCSRASTGATSALIEGLVDAHQGGVRRAA